MRRREDEESRSGEEKEKEQFTRMYRMRRPPAVFQTAPIIKQSVFSKRASAELHGFYHGELRLLVAARKVVEKSRMRVVEDGGRFSWR